MDRSFYIFWWICCLACSSYSSQVIRKKDYDELIPQPCFDFKLCKQYSATCTESRGSSTGKSSCCLKCSCQLGKKNTFYEKNLNPSCVVNPNEDDGCKYNFGSNTGSTIKGLKSIKVPPTEELDLGKLNHREAMLYSYKCLISKRQFWNLVEWKDFDEGKYFKIIKGKADHNIKLHIPKKNTSLFEGYLVKLRIECTRAGAEKLDSCIIFKIIGSRKYEAEPKKKIVRPTSSPLTAKLITKKKAVFKKSTKGPTVVKKPPKENKDTLIIVIIAVSVAILLVVCAIVTWWCWKRRTKKVEAPCERELLRPGEDPNYQNTDRFSVRHSTEIHNSANNLTYLQPVDAGLPRYHDSSKPKDNKKKKDHNYDYPDVNRFSKKSDYQLSQDNVEKPIYAEPSELRKPDPEYSDPDSITRSGTQVVGVPGYQPPSGIFCDDSKSTYSSLGVLSSDESTTYQSLLDPKDSVKGDKPSSPKYHVVEPEPTEIEV